MHLMFTDAMLQNIKDVIDAVGVAVICLGLVRSVYQFFMFIVYSKFSSDYIRLQFGESVILGLEFMVGADIIGSLIAPDYYNLGMLAIIVAVRTVLSYFLSRELHDLTPVQRKAIK